MADDFQHMNAVTKLEGADNYLLWKFQMDIMLTSAGLMPYCDGTAKQPPLEQVQETQKWTKLNANAQKFIITTVKPNVLVHLLTLKSAEEMYKKLSEIFDKDSDTRKCDLLQNFYNYKFEKRSIAENIAILQNIAFKLASLQENVTDGMIIAKILSALPATFKNFSTAWESTPSSQKTLTNLITRLTAEESKISAQDGFDVDVGVAFKTQRERECFKCKRTGHIAKDCRQQKQQKPHCLKCKVDGHRTQECRKYPPCQVCKKNNHLEADCYFKSQKEAENKPKSRNTAFVVKGNKDSAGEFFAVDSGASSHLANDIRLFANFKDEPSEFKVADNANMKGIGVGSIVTEKLTLNEVTLVPTLSTNLLSVNKITENGGAVYFKGDTVSIKNRYDEEVLTALKSENGLYQVQIGRPKRNVVLTVEENAINLHRKMAHLGVDNLKKLGTMSKGLKVKDTQFSCDICPKAKQARTPFSGHLPVATRLLEIIHSDVCGPFDTETFDGYKYYLSMLDDFSHQTHVYLLKSKAEVADRVKEYVAYVENLKGLKVGSIKIDNGKEYHPIKDWCKEKGIVIDWTVPRSPQLNSKAERLNRTLCEKMRSLLFDSGLGKEMWGEALLCAAYLTNRSPTSSLDVTPHEMWTGKEPDLGRLQIFGSVAYAKRLEYTKKLDQRSKRLIFVGYAPIGYRLYDNDKGKIVISRDVKFTTDMFKDVESEKEETETVVKIFDDSFSETIESDDSDEANASPPSPDVANPTPDRPRGLRSRNQLRRPAHLNDYTTVQDESTNDSSDSEDSVALLTFSEAEKSKEWMKAINEEKLSLEQNETWTYVSEKEAKGKRILTSRWLFRTKDNGVHKARLVVRGFAQREGHDYYDTYSPVVNFSSLRVLLTVAASKEFKIKTFDVKTAFLNSELDQALYMRIPEGFPKKPGTVCKLQKSLYGLKQSPLLWANKLKESLKTLGLKPLKTEPCIYKTDDNTMYLAVYVDDGILVGSDENEMCKFLDKLKTIFCITVEHKPDSFLGMELIKTEKGLKLSQKTYCNEVVKRFNMQDAKKTVTPIDKPDNKSLDSSELRCSSAFPYIEATGSLLYLSSKTRPDIAYAVSIETRAQDNPTDSDIINVKRTLRYLKGTPDLGLLFKTGGKLDHLKVYTDSDYAEDATRRSTTGYICYFNDVPIAWCSRRQPIVALSSTEAEFIAAADSIKEVLFLKQLIEELCNNNLSVELNVDNQSAICLIKNKVFNKRSKHIDVRYFFICERYEEKLFTIQHCPSEFQIADVFTKPLLNLSFSKFRDQMVS